MAAAPTTANKPAAAKRFADVDQLAGFAAGRLQAEARIAAFSLAGWDTHRGQKGVLGGNLEKLARLVLQVQAGLGPVWGKTLVVAMTEFGRTVAENGTQGTDHGTGGAMLLAGRAARRADLWPLAGAGRGRSL